MTNLEIKLASTARTLLFVPGDRPDRFTKAATSGADGIVLDLEDAVAPANKAVARENVRRWRADGGIGFVRINDTTSAWYEEDLAALGDQLCCVMLPKAETVHQITETCRRLSAGSRVIPILETAVGILDARILSAVPGVTRVVFGNGDLAAQVGVDHADRTALLLARSAVVLASASNGIAPPLDGVTVSVNDAELIRADTKHAAALGFTGKLCIHPRQVPIIHQALAPTTAQIQWARKTLAMARDGSATVLDGQMIDKPIVDRARRLLANET